MNLAAHFCGSRCEEILNGDYKFARQAYEYGFRRIQINATKTNNVNVDMNKLEEISKNIRSCIIGCPDIEWIIQNNSETSLICQYLESDPPKNMSFLFDSSCGLGVPISSTTLPPVHPIIQCGYAGGIGPLTITNILNLLSTSVPENHPIWVDMESSLRELKLPTKASATTDLMDHFSIKNCFECIQVGISILKLPNF
jgi:hypothetical protein